MKKNSTSFVCQECGYTTPQYLGKCPECGNWNSLKEFRSSQFTIHGKTKKDRATDLMPKTISEIEKDSKTKSERMGTGFLEMDTILGGGIVKGSVTLLAGDPGIGKSTLLLQLALNISKGTKETSSAGTKEKSTSVSSVSSGPFISSVLYISAEESEQQVTLRSQRLEDIHKNTSLFLLSLCDPDAIVEVIETTKPSLVIIDSIQMMQSESLEGLAGAVGQVRYATFLFVQAAKRLNIPIFLVGHVTKEGMVAGPMMLSHMVDTVLFLEGEKFTNTRILRSLKNRFGPIDEVCIFSMGEKGMKEVKNPETIFLDSADSRKAPGAVLGSTLEGTRAFLIEIQSLCVFSKLPYPRRVATGTLEKRLELLLAVLRKHCGLSVDTMDVFVNIVGGIKITDPGIDVAICLSLFSSLKNIPLQDTVGIGEVGLLGELRMVSGIEKRVKQAEKLGIKNIITPQKYKTLNEVLKAATK